MNQVFDQLCESAPTGVPLYNHDFPAGGGVSEQRATSKANRIMAASPGRWVGKPVWDRNLLERTRG